ncbi:ankyrin [Rhizoclosmatium globosum]|uniref:Ankyrin n=1 Tax=Rhizoclosmatium globosum TaxID=329046 RepID=A0A1Y2CP80_9FUNG|nr:ankyrin [Rhizoclosmatium globosum]|eukprot:ORY48849.1 ankyrin [Rhizoclosmatium globosum]
MGSYTTYCALCGVAPFQTMYSSDDPVKWADYNAGNQSAFKYHPRPWNNRHIEQVQVLRPSNGCPSDYGYADWGGPWKCKGGDSSDLHEWGGIGFHSSCILVLVSRVWLKGPSWIQSETTNPFTYPTMKEFVRWLHDQWDEYKGRIEGTDYGIAAPRMNQDWDLFTGEEWLLANPILLPPIYVVGGASSTGEESATLSNGDFEPTETEYFLRVQQDLLASYRLHCQGFYLRSGIPSSSNSLQPISYSPLNQPHYFKCNTISVAPFSKTPDDILFLIILYLDPTTVSRLEQSHPRFANLLRGPIGSSIWRCFCIADELVSVYPDGVLRSLHTPEMPMSCDWRRFWIDASMSENVKNLKRIMGMADVLMERFSQSSYAKDRFNRDESHDEEFDVSVGDDGGNDDGDNGQSGENYANTLTELLNDACFHDEEILVDAYVAEIASIEDHETRKDLLTNYLRQITDGSWKDRFKRFAQNHSEAFAEFTPDTVYSLAATVKSIEMLQFFLKEYANGGNLGEAMKHSTPEFAYKIWSLADAAPIDISLALSGSACLDPTLLELMLDKLPDKMTPELKEIIMRAMGHVCLNAQLLSLVIFLNRFPSWINEPCNDENTTLLSAAVSMKAYDIVHLLCKSGAKLIRNAKTMESILYEALVFNSNIKMTKILISYGANINDLWAEGAERPTWPSRQGAVNSGSTLLHLAVVQKNLLALYFLVKEQGMSINVPDSQGNTALHLAAGILVDTYDGDRDGYEYPGVEYDLCILSSYLTDLMKSERIVPKSVVTKFLVNYLLEGGYEWVNGNVDTTFNLKVGYAGPSDFTVLFRYAPGHVWWDLKGENIWKELQPDMVGTLCSSGYRIPPHPVHIIQMLIELGSNMTAVNKNGQTALDIAIAGGGCKMNVKALEVAMKELKVSA